MKKFVLIIAVITVHLLLLAWLFRGCSQAENVSTGPRIPRQDEPETTGVGGASDSAPQAGEVDAKASAAAGDKNIYTPGQLQSPQDKLPDDMRLLANACRSGVLVDFTQNRILWQKNPETPGPIASMTKMMTILMLMESLERRSDLTLDTPVPVSRTAAAIGGRQVYLDPREQFTIEELLKCTVIRSANDTAFLIAEFLAKGDVQAFIERMNQRAEQLGFPTAEFGSPHGLPINGQRIDQASPLEMAYLARLLLDYPTVTKWSSTRLDSIRDDNPQFPRFQLLNTNKLVEKVPGVNGMKTGYTDAAGYCITATCERSRRVLIAVVTGCKTGAARNDFVRELLDWGYQQ